MKCNLCDKELNPNETYVVSDKSWFCEDCWKHIDCQCGLEKL